VVGVIGSLATTAGAAQVSGVVREQGTLLPISGAIVSLQATAYRTTTLGDGSYALDVPAGSGQVIVAAHKGHYNASIVVGAPASGADIVLDAVPMGSDPSYALVAPSTCGACHPLQLLQWTGTPMANAGLNTWVHDVYSGTGTAGGLGGFVYVRDSVLAGSNPDSECAACHQPEIWIDNAFSGPLDDTLVAPPSAVVHGVSCDVCHKVADIDESKLNFPGIYPGVVTFAQPEGPSPAQVQYGVLGDVDFAIPSVMRASYQPEVVAEVCAACHQDKNDPDGDGDFEEPNGVISEPTYHEWADSPYGDPQSPQYATCVDCHMPPSGATAVCSVLVPPLVRDPATIRTHAIRGTTPEFLENAVDLALQAQGGRRHPRGGGGHHQLRDRAPRADRRDDPKHDSVD
jgi:hypothetical protein